MITTKRTALSEKEFETKLNTRIETDYQPDNTIDIAPLTVSAPVVEAQRITPARSQEDVMPTIKATRKTVANNEVEQLPEVKAETKTVAKIDPKTKVIISVYLVATFILSMIVLATGLMIGGQSAQVAGLENSVSQAYNVMASQQDQMAYLSDEAVVAYSANELGMVDRNTGEEIELIPLQEEPTYEERTNGFDKFCDFISSIFGG